MWKIRAVGVMALAAMIGWLSVATADDVEQPAPAVPRVQEEPVAPQQELPGIDNEMARRVAKDFAPWIEAVIQEKPTVANRLYPLRRPAQDAVGSPNSLRIFRKFPKLDGMTLALIGGRSLGDQTGVVLFTITTESGPVAFKIYHYRFGDTRSVGRVEISDEWGEIERMYTTVDPLPAPVLVPL